MLYQKEWKSVTFEVKKHISRTPATDFDSK
jgi:hypothetical protein